MGSDVIFDSLYLDRCLRSGRYLDIIMLLLLGVASLMFRSDSVVFGLPGSCVWWWMIWCHLIFWSITHSTLYWGMFPSWMRFTDLDGVARLSPLARCTPRRWSIRYFYNDPSMEPLQSHSARSFLTCHTLDAILGHISFRMRFTDLHGVACLSPLTRYTPRRWPVCYFIMIPW